MKGVCHVQRTAMCKCAPPARSKACTFLLCSCTLAETAILLQAEAVLLVAEVSRQLQTSATPSASGELLWGSL